MSPFKQRIIGELIGLARATDGNGHLISQAATTVILDCLSAEPVNEEELFPLLKRIEAVKRSMVPDCFLCANPCGRTSVFDLSQLHEEAESISVAKIQILESLFTISKQTAAISKETLIYQCLIAIGMEDIDLELLRFLAAELNT